MNNYYDPAVAAQVAAYVNYICPVLGAQAEMEKIDPELASSEFIFPTDAMLNETYVFMELTQEQNEAYERLFQKAIGN
jgi:spermidine/putrescine transport system substrate-binding protein